MVLPRFQAAVLPNPVRICRCGKVFRAQDTKSFHLGSECQSTALWTCLFPQCFDGARWSTAENSVVAQDLSTSAMAMLRQEPLYSTRQRLSH